MLIRSFFYQAGRAVLLGLVFLFAGTTWAATIEVTGAIGRKVMGTEARAEELAQLYERQYKDVMARVAKASGGPKKKVYFELGQAGADTVGLDSGLTLVTRLRTPAYAKAVQLYLEYDPAPPFNAGSPDKAPRLAREFLTDMFAELTQAAHATARRAMARLG